MPHLARIWADHFNIFSVYQKIKECSDLHDRIEDYENTIEVISNEQHKIQLSSLLFPFSFIKELREEKDALLNQVREVQLEYSM